MVKVQVNWQRISNHSSSVFSTDNGDISELNQNANKSVPNFEENRVIALNITDIYYDSLPISQTQSFSKEENYEMITEEILENPGKVKNIPPPLLLSENKCSKF